MPATTKPRTEPRTGPGLPDNADDYLEVTVTVKMTPAQRRAYASEYGLAAGPLLADEVRAATWVVPADVRERIGEHIGAKLSEDYMIAEFTTVSVGQPS